MGFRHGRFIKFSFRKTNSGAMKTMPKKLAAGCGTEKRVNKQNAKFSRCENRASHTDNRSAVHQLANCTHATVGKTVFLCAIMQHAGSARSDAQSRVQFRLAEKKNDETAKVISTLCTLFLLIARASLDQ